MNWEKLWRISAKEAEELEKRFQFSSTSEGQAFKESMDTYPSFIPNTIWLESFEKIIFNLLESGEEYKKVVNILLSVLMNKIDHLEPFSGNQGTHYPFLIAAQVFYTRVVHYMSPKFNLEKIHSVWENIFDKHQIKSTLIKYYNEQKVLEVSAPKREMPEDGSFFGTKSTLEEVEMFFIKAAKNEFDITIFDQWLSELIDEFSGVGHKFIFDDAVVVLVRDIVEKNPEVTGSLIDLLKRSSSINKKCLDAEECIVDCYLAVTEAFSLKGDSENATFFANQGYDYLRHLEYEGDFLIQGYGENTGFTFLYLNQLRKSVLLSEFGKAFSRIAKIKEN